MSNKIAIEVEGLGKQYRLGSKKSNSLMETLGGLFKSQSPDKNTFWALKDLDLEIKQGEAIGIIGKNGAGKSTFLKILSKITHPTEGRIKINGRLASLLEVGTGFHPELTGRENIFLNGTILGMNRHEIRQKLDEIVAFSGVEKFLDTPVKHYSSGMYVRLAFAVAAHLEPEILVIDEVLAVGDAEFQKKCLGKMEDVANEGRTVLFVSHNMTAMKTLCRHGILLDSGRCTFNGEMGDTIDFYLSSSLQAQLRSSWQESESPRNDNITFYGYEIVNSSKEAAIYIHSSFAIKLKYSCTAKNKKLDITLKFYNDQGILIFVSGTGTDNQWFGKVFPTGIYETTMEIPAHLLNSGLYYADIVFGHAQREVLLHKEQIIVFEVLDSAEGRGSSFHRAPGIFRPQFPCTTIQLENESKVSS